MAGAPMGGQMPNINQAAAQGIYGAGAGTAANMYNPLQTANIAAYQNPYTSQVIGATAMDLERQRQMQQNAIGAAATRAGAFGGSREAIERAATNEAFMRNLGQTAAGLRQAGFTQAQTAAQQDIQNRLQAAGQLADISNLGFGMGQTAQQNLAQQGALQQMLQQQLFDAAQAQYAGYQGAPTQSLNYLTSALSSAPIPQSQTSSSKPGLLDIAGSALAAYALWPSDENLKTDIKLKKTLKNGIQVFTWKWNEKAKEIGADKFPSVGVIAQKIMDKLPNAVIRGEDGYLRVNYADPALAGV